MADELPQSERDLLEIFGIPEEQIEQRKASHARYTQLTETRTGKLFVLCMWLQQGYSQHGHDNVLLLRREGAMHHVTMIDMGGTPYTSTGEALPVLSDEEIDALLFETQHTIASHRLEDGRVLSVVPLTYGRARLCVGSKFSALIYDTAY